MLLQPFFLFFSYLLFTSVQSCRTVSESSGTLTGVCPNDTVTVPIGKQLDYECTGGYTGPFVVYWNISGDTVDVNTFPKPPGINVGTIGGKSTLTITALTNSTVVDIYCGLCITSCFPKVEEQFIGTESIQLITFGKTVCM